MDITTKRVAEVSDLPIKNADGTPLLDEKQHPITATVFGPGTKIWQVANANMQRAGIKRTRENNGKWEASVDNAREDQIKFLCTITKRFNGLEYPGAESDGAIVEAIYSDDTLGFIRDHMMADTKNWENFMKAAQSLPSDTAAS